LHARSHSLTHSLSRSLTYSLPTSSRLWCDVVRSRLPPILVPIGAPSQSASAQQTDVGLPAAIAVHASIPRSSGVDIAATQMEASSVPKRPSNVSGAHVVWCSHVVWWSCGVLAWRGARVVWCSREWCGVAWWSEVRCGAVRCGAVRCGAVQCSVVRCGVVRCCARVSRVCGARVELKESGWCGHWLCTHHCVTSARCCGTFSRTSTSTTSTTSTSTIITAAISTTVTPTATTTSSLPPLPPIPALSIHTHPHTHWLFLPRVRLFSTLSTRAGVHAVLRRQPYLGARRKPAHDGKRCCEHNRCDVEIVVRGPAQAVRLDPNTPPLRPHASACRRVHAELTQRTRLQSPVPARPDYHAVRPLSTCFYIMSARCHPHYLLSFSKPRVCPSCCRYMEQAAAEKKRFAIELDGAVGVPPKRPVNAYLLFAQSKRPELKQV
jgi:hypothetical protein